MKIVILAGGSGTRLWPLSRQKKPKQLQSFVTNRTLLQDTLARVKSFGAHNIYIATNQEYLNEVRRQAKPFKIPRTHFIIEPALRDTAPCIGLAATYLAAHGFADETMAIIYADHLIQKEHEFKKLLHIADTLTQTDNTLNIIEVKAKFPNVNLGYVKIGKIIKRINGAEIYSFERFIEKPNLETAKRLLASYKYLWNTGLYIWKPKTILAHFAKHLPKTARHLKTIQRAIGTASEQKTLRTHYPQCDKISIDYGIMEKVSPKLVRIIPADLGWSDIGTWEAIFDELAVAATSNIIKADHIGIDTTGSLIYGKPKKIIATVGVSDLVIVDTADALLICHKGESQKVKRIVERLNKRQS